MKLSKPEIPSAFVRLDTRINEADQFANVYAQQRLRRNHNILMARRSRRVLFTITGDGGAHNFLKPASLQDGDSLFSVPLSFSHRYIKEIVLNMRILLSPVAAVTVADVTLYPVITGHDEVREINPDVSIVVDDDTAFVSHTVTVPIPQGARGPHGGRLTVVGDGFMQDADADGPLAISAAGRDWVETTVPTSAGGAGGLYVVTDGSIRPRRITQIRSAASGGGDRVTVYPRFDKTPIPGTDTVALRHCAKVRLDSACGYELGIDDFSSEPANFIL